MTDRQNLESKLKDAISADLFEELGDCIDQMTDEELVRRIEREETTIATKRELIYRMWMS